ncbi:uncharacterized protein LOC108933848 [Scleropages formosus]|uniref:uncharacterized protein LOC108933848 n=1 Tax=Scleropages formosus TaxID=113540 RepID=UPI0010FAA9B3|nr:uncharacterized protein LOC108933848 [Scleropages formosus]
MSVSLSPLGGLPPTLLLTALIALIGWSPASCSVVLEMTRNYQCPEKGWVTLTYEHNISHCQQSWDWNQTRIAIYDHQEQCITPCVKVYSGKLFLYTCENVTLTFFCLTSAQDVNETRVHFIGIISRKQEYKNHPVTVKGDESPAGPPGDPDSSGSSVATSGARTFVPTVVVVVAIVVIVFVVIVIAALYHRRRQQQHAQPVPHDNLL